MRHGREPDRPGALPEPVVPLVRTIKSHTRLRPASSPAPPGTSCPSGPNAAALAPNPGAAGRSPGKRWVRSPFGQTALLPGWELEEKPPSAMLRLQGVDAGFPNTRGRAYLTGLPSLSKRDFFLPMSSGFPSVPCHAQQFRGPSMCWKAGWVRWVTRHILAPGVRQWMCWGTRIGHGMVEVLAYGVVRAWLSIPLRWVFLCLAGTQRDRGGEECRPAGSDVCRRQTQGSHRSSSWSRCP